MICSEIMTKDPECCVPSDSVMTAAQLMKSEDVGPIPIVESKEDKKLAGIVTDRDLAIKVVAEARDPKTTQIEEVMSEGLVTCRENDDIQSVLELMEENQILRIQFLAKADHLVGSIAQADVATRLHSPRTVGKVVEQISD